MNDQLNDKQDPVIRIENLQHSYDGKTTVLKNIGLSVHPGQIIGYIGPNGAGKTTTVKILTGMLDGFQGNVSVLGYNMALESLTVKKKIGYIPENAALYETLTPMEYLGFIGRFHDLDIPVIKNRAGKMLEAFGLGDQKHRRMTSFSKGMKQKVLIIAGMIHNPEILFLDEPLAGLDANTTITIKEIITRLAAKGKTVFYCSHIMDVVERICHRIIIIDKGTIVADGPFTQLQQAAGSGETLEKIFTRLTGAHEYSHTAEQFIDALEE